MLDSTTVSCRRATRVSASATLSQLRTAWQCSLHLWRIQRTDYLRRFVEDRPVEPAMDAAAGSVAGACILPLGRSYRVRAYGGARRRRSDRYPAVVESFCHLAASSNAKGIMLASVDRSSASLTSTAQTLSSRDWRPSRPCR